MGDILISREMITDNIVKYQSPFNPDRLVYKKIKENLAIQIEIPTKEEPLYLGFWDKLFGAKQLYRTVLDEEELALEQQKALFILNQS